MSDRPLPQVNTPHGRVMLDADPDEFIPLLDRLLRESFGEVIEPPPNEESRSGPALPLARVRLPSPAVPRREDHPDHHLWDNHGVWFIVYTIHPTPVTKERLRYSMQTRCVETARRRRDQILARCAAEGILATSRQTHLGS